MATAPRKVLGIPELLEAILLELPPRDLLLSERVNKDFKAIIERSNGIQQTLFFKPRSEKEDGTAVANPFLLHILRRHGISCDIVMLGAGGPRYGTNSNYILKQYDRSITWNEEHRISAFACIEIVLSKIHHEFLPNGQANDLYRAMLVSDPPVRVQIRWYGGLTPWRKVAVSTLSDLIEACWHARI